MANYDNKLGEWFKQVEQQEKALKDKKTVGGPDSTGEPRPIVDQSPQPSQVRGMTIEGPAREAAASVVATIEAVEVIADTTLVASTDNRQTLADGEETVARLFGENEVPQVEDFFSFLNRSSEQPVVEEVEEHVFELPKNQSKLNISEGTGDPRPLTTQPAAPAQRMETPVVQQRIETPPAPKPVVAPKPQVASQPKVAPDAGTQENWDRMPRHLQTLFGAASQEVAQNSYKAFKETREDLVQRLLDPTISLEDAARILNVCPTTVRRYTNRGVLKHYRTAGNQRRFKLSDVLVFMENGQRGANASDESKDSSASSE